MCHESSLFSGGEIIFFSIKLYVLILFTEYDETDAELEARGSD